MFQVIGCIVETTRSEARRFGWRSCALFACVTAMSMIWRAAWPLAARAVAWLMAAGNSCRLRNLGHAFRCDARLSESGFPVSYDPGSHDPVRVDRDEDLWRRLCARNITGRQIVGGAITGAAIARNALCRHGGGACAGRCDLGWRYVVTSVRDRRRTGRLSAWVRASGAGQLFPIRWARRSLHWRICSNAFHRHDRGNV